MGRKRIPVEKVVQRMMDKLIERSVESIFTDAIGKERGRGRPLDSPEVLAAKIAQRLIKVVRVDFATELLSCPENETFQKLLKERYNSGNSQ